MATKKNIESEVKEPKKEEYVTIKLFKDAGKYKDDVYVGVNGKGYLIQRGKEVSIPKSVWLVLEQSLKQDEATAALIEKESSQEKEYKF